MLTEKEEAQLEKLIGKKAKRHVPLTKRELKEMKRRSTGYMSDPIGQHLKTMTGFLNELGSWGNMVATDNMRLLQDIEYYINKLEQTENEVSTEPKPS